MAQPIRGQCCISYRNQLICTANQITVFYMKYNTRLKRINSVEYLTFTVSRKKSLLPADASLPVKVLYNSGCSNSKASTKCFMPLRPLRLIKSRNRETFCILVFPEFITLSQSSSSITLLLRR